ncbi:MAG: hypothetical protein U9N45_08515 [Gemmatimonadota bacterium]|nr:hypothetical protein [Gemmatimonadota bacterium]
MAGACFFPGLSQASRAAVIYGGLTGSGLSLSGYILLVRSIEAPESKFLKLVLGGMVLRIMLGLAVVAAGIGLFRLPPVGLVVSCFASYTVFMILEYFYLYPLLTDRKKA